MKVLHFFYYDNKFFPQFYQLIVEKFKIENHHFIVMVNEDMDKKKMVNVTYVTNSLNFSKLYKMLMNSDKIILHSLMLGKLLINFVIMPKLLKKTFWAIWGADLYFYYEKKESIKDKVFELIRSYIIQRLYGMITQVEADAKLAKKLYKSKAKWFYSFMYPSNLFKNPQTIQTNQKNDDTLFIQIGNSADKSNNHIEIIDMLSVYKEDKIKIYAPLSYGDKNYANKVVMYGKQIFGEKFVPILEFMPLKDYVSWQESVDVAVFNHRRQQALGNITTLIGYGKKVYIRDNITTWNFCNKHRLKVYDIDNITENLQSPMNNGDKLINIAQIKKMFSMEKLLKDLHYIFEYKIIEK